MCKKFTFFLFFLIGSFHFRLFSMVGKRELKRALQCFKVTETGEGSILIDTPTVGVAMREEVLLLCHKTWDGVLFPDKTPASRLLDMKKDLTAWDGDVVADAAVSGRLTRDFSEVEAAYLKIAFERHKRMLEKRSLAMKRRFRERATDPKLIVLGAYLSEQEIEKVGRPVSAWGIGFDEVVAYKVDEGKYIYAKVRNIYRRRGRRRLSYSLITAKASRVYKKPIMAHGEKVFKIYKCKVHPSFK